jgi:glycosyltransferase involved in cell wall biosynthesis
MEKTKVLLFGTHPRQFNGYSKVVYELAKMMYVNHKDIELTIYGFQNFYANKDHRLDVPTDITIYDAFANEDPKRNGFGIAQVKDYVIQVDPDVCIVYNDMVVLHQVITQLHEIPDRRFKIIAYVDQVYLNQKKDFIQFINDKSDKAMLFTKYWEDVIRQQGITIPTCYLPHGINPQTYYPVPKHLARTYYGLKNDDFIILNLNRNQPRKRWDTCLKAFAEIVSRYPEHPIKLLVGTAIQGGWNLLEIFERELNKRGVNMDVGMRHLILFDNPQKVTDEATNILYNVADIGINTCDGEGFGLCNFEQAAVGIPQIVPKLGGFLEFFDDSCALMIEPCMAYYVDNSRDMVCGEALLCNYMDFADAIEKYYLSNELRKQHGAAARKKIIANYSWGSIADKLCDIVKSVLPPKVPRVDKEISELGTLIEKIDINTLDLKTRNQQIMNYELKLGNQDSPATAVTQESKEPSNSKASTTEEDSTQATQKSQKATTSKSSHKKKKKGSKKALDKKALLLLKKKLDKILEDDDDDDDDDEELA